MPYEFGRSIGADESRNLEFKTVTSQNPARAIASVCDEYAVAFLNSQGGTVLWGIRDTDKVVVGVALTEGQRDEVRRAINDKLHNIEPRIDPTRFRVEIDEVEHAPEDAELFVVSLTVPRVTSGGPFYASGNDAYVRIDGAIKKLKGQALTEWILGRASSRKGQPTIKDTTPIEIYYKGEKLPMVMNVVCNYRDHRSNDRPSLIFDFHLPAQARARRKQRFGLITSSFITWIGDWGTETPKLTVLPDGRHLFQSDMSAADLLPGDWYKYTFSVGFRGSILGLDRVEDMAFRFFSEDGIVDVPFGVWLIGKHDLTMAEEVNRMWRTPVKSNSTRKKRSGG